MENYNNATIQQIMDHDLISEPVVTKIANISRMAVCCQCQKPKKHGHAGVLREAIKNVKYSFGLTTIHDMNLCDNCSDRRVKHYKHQGLMLKTGVFK